jgi:biopolymer transport protein ExbD
MRQRRSLSNREVPSTDDNTINLTPLIDVVFVVLILFILIAPMLEVDKIQLAKAGIKEEKEIASVQESSPIALHVREDNSIWLNRKQVTQAELVSLLKIAKRQNPHHTPQLFHDKKAQFGTYQTVKNALELAGFEELDILLEPE